MKRTGYLYEKMCDLDTIKYAIRKASVGKTSRNYVRKILLSIDLYANNIYKMLINQNITLSPTTKKIIYDKSSRKNREITIPRFYPDQIIHWLVIIVIQPILTRGMYRHCCGSVPNRGGIDAKKYVESIIHIDKKMYCVKLDIKKFFDHIDTEILLKMLNRKIKDNKILKLISQILVSGGEHLPIGFYTSQWFSNFYLEGFDHFIKETLRIRYYVRYVDDIVLIDTNKRKLHKALIEIKSYLNTINLEIKDNWQLWKLHSRPIDFVGFRFYKNKTLLRKRIFFRLCRNIRKIKKTNNVSVHQAMSTISLLGWLKHINGKYFYLNNIRPIVSKNKLTRIVSNYNRRNYGIREKI